MPFTDVLCLQMKKKRRDSETQRKSGVESGRDEQVTKPRATDEAEREGGEVARRGRARARRSHSREEAAGERKECESERENQW